MSPHDAHGHPLLVGSPQGPNAGQTPPASPLSRFLTNKPLKTCHDQGINKPSDTETHEIDQASPPPSPYRFHRRHSHLSHHQEPVVDSSSVPEPSTSPDKLSQIEKDQPAPSEQPQQQDEAARTDLHPGQQGAKDTAKERREQEWKAKDAEIEFDEEKHILKGGWMHRSRGSCELLRERKSWDARG